MHDGLIHGASATSESRSVLGKLDSLVAFAGTYVRLVLKQASSWARSGVYKSPEMSSPPLTPFVLRVRMLSSLYLVNDNEVFTRVASVGRREGDSSGSGIARVTTRMARAPGEGKYGVQ